jgi:hypothetical protein
MPKKKSKSADSAKRQPKVPSKKRPATPTSDTKETTTNPGSETYSRATDSVIDRIRSMVSDSTNTLTTPIKSPKKKRVVPAKTRKKPAADSSIHVTLPTAPVDMHVSDVVSQTEGKATDSVIDRIRSMVSEPTNTSTPPEHSPKRKRVVPARAPKKSSTDLASRVITPQPAKPNVTTASKAQPTNNSVRLPMPEQDVTPDSYEIPFDMDAYLREKEDAPKLHLNRVQERTSSPSSRGWVLVHMSHGEFPQKKLKCGLQLFWQVPHDIGKMYLGDHVFLCQSEGVKAGIIGHGYVADLPMLWGDVHRSRIVHNVKKPNTHTHVIGVRVVSAHKRIEYPVMRSMPLVSTINIPTMHIPYRQPLTTEQTFALLELWYM